MFLFGEDLRIESNLCIEMDIPECLNHACMETPACSCHM